MSQVPKQMWTAVSTAWALLKNLKLGAVGSVWECKAVPMLGEAWTMFLQQQNLPQTRITGQTEPNPVQLLPTLNKALISGCVRGAALLEASAPLMEKGKTLSLSTFLMTLRQEWLYPNPTEEQECYRQCFKYLMFTQHSEYKWQFKEKGTPVSVSSSGSFLFMCVFQLD